MKHYVGTDGLTEWPINVASSDQTIKAFQLKGINLPDSKEGTLSALAKKEPIAKTILEYRSDTHMVTSFLDPYIRMVNPATGRLHAEFNQLGDEDRTIVSGRFSSKQPNLQQVPAFDDSIRLCFSGGYLDEEVEVEDYFDLFELDEVETQKGFQLAKDLDVEFLIKAIDGSFLKILKICENNKILRVYVKPSC